MKILLSPSSAETRPQQPHHHQIVTSSIATLTESQLNHYLKLQAAQQQSQTPSSQKNEVIVEGSRFEQHPRPAAVVDSPSDPHQQQPRQHNHRQQQQQQQQHQAVIVKSEAMPSTTVATSNPSDARNCQQQYHHHHHHQQQQQPQQHNGHHHNGHHHNNGSTTTTSKPSAKFSTTPNHPPLPHKKMIMGKIEHDNEALENEAAMQQHAQNLLQLSQEPLVLPVDRRASSSSLQHPSTPSPNHHHQPQQQHHVVRDHQELVESAAPQDLVFRGQKLKDSSAAVGYFMEVGPTTTTTTTPSIRLTAAPAASDVEARSAEAASQERQSHLQHHHIQQPPYNPAMLQSRIMPKDEPMSPRSLASSPLASGSASPRSPVSNSIGAHELTQRLAAKGLLPQQLQHLQQHPQIQHHLQQEQQVVISPAETLVISTSALEGDNYIVSSANSPTSTVAVMAGSPDIPQTKIPGTTVYEGECGFRISFAPQMKETKSAQWTYSSMLHKLFTRINAACPIRFQCAYKLPPSGTVLRALPIYMQPEHVCEAVVRCPVHAASPLDLDAPQPQSSQCSRPTNHLIRADHPHAEYVDSDPQYGRQSVSVPFEAPAVGTQWSTVLYRYMCNSSCAGGMNRRPIQTVFTLETPTGEVIGRQVVEVRICACPGRDSKVEERNVLNKGAEAAAKGFILDGPLSMSSSSSPIGADAVPVAGRKRKRAVNNEAAPNNSHLHDDEEAPSGSQGGDDRVFTLLVRGRETYELLKRIRDSIELSKMASSDQLDRLQAMDAEMEQQVNAASSLISFMSQPPEIGSGQIDGN